MARPLGAVERAGLDYAITVDIGRSPDDLKRVRQGFKGVRDEWKAFRSEVQRGRGQLDAAARAAERLRKATGTGPRPGEAAAARRRIVSLRQETRARQSLLDVERRQAAVARAARSVDQRATRRALEQAEAVRRTVRPLREVRDAIRRKTEAQRAGNIATERAIRLSRDYVRSLKLEAAALARVADSARARAAAVQSGAAATAAGAGAAATARAPIDPAVLAQIDRQMAELEARARRIRGQVAFPEARRGRQNLLGVAAGLDAVDRSAGTAGLSVGRLAALFGGFIVVRRILLGIRDAIKAGLDFNSAVEQGILGVQTLLVSNGQLFDAQGQLVTGQEAFAAATGEARRQVRLLRLDGLRTAATFDQLLETFQQALGVGLPQGLSADQIRQLVVRVSQAAAAVGLPQQQLPEEIRSLLVGTITPRNTRIAVALGITNEDIRRAKEAGELAEFLLDRFSAFEEAGERALNNYTTIISNLKDAVGQVLGAGTEQLFEDIKRTLQEITAELITQSETGVAVNPDAIVVVQAFTAGIREALREGKKVADALTLDDAVSVAGALGDTVGLIARTLGNLGRGFTQGLRDARRVARGLLGDLSGNIFGEGFDTSIVTMTRLLTVAVAVRLVLRGFLLPLTLGARAIRFMYTTALLLVPGLKGALDVLRSIRGVSLLVSAPFLAIAAAVGLVVATFNNDFIRSIDIGGQKVGTIVDLFKADLVFAVERAAIFFERSWVNATVAVRKAVLGLITGLGSALLEVVKRATEAAGLVGAIPSDLANASVANIEAAQGRLQRIAELGTVALTNEKQRRLEQLEQNIADAEAARLKAQDAAREFERTGDRRTLSEALSEAADAFFGLFDRVQKTPAELEKSAAASRSILDAVRDIGIGIGSANRDLSDQLELLKDIGKEARSSSEALMFSQATQGLEGVALEIERLLFESRSSFRSTVEEVDKSVAAAEARLQALDAQEGRIRQEAAAIGVRRLASIRTATDLIRGQAEAGRALLALDQERVRLGAEKVRIERRIREAGGAGDASLVAQLQEVERQITRTEARIEGITAASRRTLQAFVLQADSADKILDLTKRQLEIEQQRKIASSDLAELDRQRAELRDAAREKESADLARIATEEAGRRARESETRAAQIRAEARRLQILSRRPSGISEERKQETALIQLEIEAERALLAIEQKRLRINIESVEARLQSTTNAQARVALQELLNQLIQEENQLLAESGNRVEELKARLAEIGDSSFAKGFGASVQGFIDQALDPEKVGEKVGSAIAGTASASLSEAIQGAFDPTKGLGDVLENFGQSLFRIVSDAIAQALIAELFLGLGQGSRPQGGGFFELFAALFGAAQGGQVPKRARPSAAHFASPQGFAKGGRPAGLDPRDTVPAWLQPGEWVIRLAAVRKYGADILAAINSGSIDPMALRGLASARRMRGTLSSVSSGPGYASGGSVRQAISDAAARRDRPIEMRTIIVRTEEELHAALQSDHGQEVIVNVVTNQGEELHARERFR